MVRRRARTVCNAPIFVSQKLLAHTTGCNSLTPLSRSFVDVRRRRKHWHTTKYWCIQSSGPLWRNRRKRSYATVLLSAGAGQCEVHSLLWLATNWKRNLRRQANERPAACTAGPALRLRVQTAPFHEGQVNQPSSSPPTRTSARARVVGTKIASFTARMPASNLLR